ncbi:hypothetical protein AAMO2058_000087900 [Amorphochlora amoebiformis]
MLALLGASLISTGVDGTGATCPCPCSANQKALITRFETSTCLPDNLKSDEFFGYTPAKAVGTTVKLEMLSWPSQWISNFITAIISREVLSYTTDFTCATSGHNANARIANRETDILVEFWWDTYVSEARQYVVRNPLVSDAGSIGYYGRSGVYMPSYTADLLRNNITWGNTSQDLRDFAIDSRNYWRILTLPDVVNLYTSYDDTDIVNALGSPMFTFTPSWCTEWRVDGNGNTCIDIKAEDPAIDKGQLHQVIVNLQLRMTISYWTTSGLEYYVSRKLERREPVLFKYWEPVGFLAGLAVDRIEFPTYTTECHSNNTGSIQGQGSVDCDFPRVSIRKIFHNTIISDSASRYYGINVLLRRFDITDSQMEGMLQNAKIEGKDAFDVACDFLKTNNKTWMTWVPKIVCQSQEGLIEGVCSPLPLMENKNQINTSARNTGLFAASAIIIIASCLLIWLYWNRASPILKAAMPTFLTKVAVGCLVSTSSVVFLGMDDRSFSPSFLVFSCNIQLWLYSIGFALTYSGVLTKFFVVKKLLVSKRVEISWKDRLQTTISGVIIEALLLGVWSAVDRFEYVRECEEYDRFGRCTSSRGYCTGSNNWLLGLILLSHLGVMIYSLFLCYKCRRLPRTVLEVEWMTTALVSNFQISVMGVFLLYILRQNPTYFYVIQTFVILFGDGCMLFTLFLPKVHQEHFYDRDDSQ